MFILTKVPVSGKNLKIAVSKVKKRVVAMKLALLVLFY